MSIEPAVPTPLRWSEVPITFSCVDQWTSFSEPGRFPLVLKPVVAGSKLNKVLIDSGSGLNVLFTKTLKKMKLDITHMLTKSNTPFYGIVPGNAAIPLGSVVLPVTFGESRDNYRTEYIKFEVADFESSYHAILGRPAIAKFMAVPHYTHLVLKMPSPAGVLSLQGDLKIFHDCDTEAVEIASTNQVPNAMMEVLSHLFITCTFKAKRGTWHCLVEGYLASLHDFVSLKVMNPIGSRMISISKQNPVTRPSLKLVEFSFLRIKHLQPKTRK
jgi:hypothetical protein